jgi:transposase
MARSREAPADMDCPYRHACPHLEGMACCWVLENYQEAFELREREGRLLGDYQRRIDELTKMLEQRDATIARLTLQHRKQFKANLPRGPESRPRPAARRGAPLGHRPWRREEPTVIDRRVEVPAPQQCPHCGCEHLGDHPERYEHVQEDIVPPPRPVVTAFVHQQSWCPKCRRGVYQLAPGELPGKQIGPQTRALAIHLRYQLQIPYRKTRHILKDLLGMPLVPASAMAFDRAATKKGLPLYEEIRVKLQASPVVHADETSWREDGHNHFVWYGGHQSLAFFQITPDRSSESAVELLGEEFGGTLVTDDYAAYNASEPEHQQTCWAHLARAAKDLLTQMELTDPPVKASLSVRFLGQVKRLASDVCELGRQQTNGKLKPAAARAMIPRLHKRLRRIAAKPLDYPPAETLRRRIYQKDRDKLFTFLSHKGVEPTNTQAERSIRPHVIMRKICNGTRSPEGSLSHAVLPSLLQTAQRQGKQGVAFLCTLISDTLGAARQALFASGP